MPRMRYHQMPACVFVSGSTTEVAGVFVDQVTDQGYFLCESCTSYVVAPTAGCHAISGESCTVGVLDAEATTRPFGARPETQGVLAFVVTTGCETLPKLIPWPRSHWSCGTSVSWYSIGWSLDFGSNAPNDEAVTGTTVQ